MTWSKISLSINYTHLQADRVNDNIQGLHAVLLRCLERAVNVKGIIHSIYLNLYALREDDLPLLQPGPYPLSDLKPDEVAVLRLQEIIQAPAEILIIKELAPLGLGLKDNGLIKALQLRTEGSVSCSPVTEPPPR